MRATLRALGFASLIACALSASAFAANDYPHDDRERDGSRFAKPPSEVEFREGWNSGELFGTGPAYAKLGEKESGFIETVIKYFKDLAYAGMRNQALLRQQLESENPLLTSPPKASVEAADILTRRIHFALFASDAPNAFANEFYNAGSIRISETFKLAPPQAFQDLFGSSSHRSYVGYVVRFNDYMLKLNLTEGELAFTIAHELGHIQNGDTALNYKIASQQMELAADRVALQAIAGRYPLDAALSFFHKFNAWMENCLRNDLAQSVGNSFFATHPDSGVRYTALQKEIEELRAAGKDTAKSDRPVSIDISRLNASVQNFQPKNSLSKEQIEIFFKRVLDTSFTNEALFGRVAEIKPYFLEYGSPEIVQWASMNVLKYSAQDISILVSQWIDVIDGPLGSKHPAVLSWNSAEKVNQFLKICLLLFSVKDKFWSQENALMHKKIIEFLSRHTGDGSQAFNSRSFRSPIKSSGFDNDSGSKLAKFIREFWLDPDDMSLETSTALVELRPQWQTLFSHIIGHSLSDLHAALAKLQAFGKTLKGVYLKAVEEVLIQEENEFLSTHQRLGVEELIQRVYMLTEIKETLEQTGDSRWKRLFPKENLRILVDRLATVSSAIEVTDWDKIIKIHFFERFSPTQLKSISKKFQRDLPELALNSKKIPYIDRFASSTHIIHFVKQLPSTVHIESLLRYLDTSLKDLGIKEIEALGAILLRASPRLIWNNTGRISREDRDRAERDLAIPLSASMDWTEKIFLRDMAAQLERRLALLGIKSIQDPRTINVFTFSDLTSLMTELRQSTRILKRSQEVDFLMSAPAVLFSLQLLIRYQNEYASKGDWLNDLTTITACLERVGLWLKLPAEARDKMAKSLNERITSLNAQELKVFLYSKNASYILDDRDLGSVIARYVNLTAATSGDLHSSAQSLLSELDEKQKFSTHRMRAWTFARNEAAKLNQAQPSDTKYYERAAQTGLVKGDDGLIRLTSEVAGQIRSLSQKDFFMALDYLLGHSDTKPNFTSKKTKADAEIHKARLAVMTEIRTALIGADVGIRVLAANILLTGPDGIVFSQNGLATLTEQLLSNLPVDSMRETCRAILDALIEMEGLNRSLPFALVKAQPPSIVRGKNPEIAFIKGFIEATGVPGGKLAQYLSFTKAFNKYGESLSDFQDQPFPMGYIQMLQEVRASVGQEWLNKNRILGIAGFGTVNVAVYYASNENPSNVRVLKFLRQNIVSKTELDFSRITRLLEILRARFPNNREYQAISGLMPLIRRSLLKEFSQSHVLEINRLASSIYSSTRRGIQVRAIPVDGAVSKSAIEMEKANGVTAKTLHDKDFAAYSTYMAAFLELERDVLLGALDDSNGRGIVNPDIHNGQLIIDANKNKISLIDMSQSSAISKTERFQAVALLRVISKLYGIEPSQKLLRDYFSVEIPSDELKQIFNSSSRMDIFIHLIAAIELKGVSVPTATADWILAFDRWLSLGKGIGWHELQLVQPFFTMDIAPPKLDRKKCEEALKTTATHDWSNTIKQSIDAVKKAIGH